MDMKDAKARRKAPLDAPTGLTLNATRDISARLRRCSPTCLLST